ncbi:MAG TPA: helix-turn-helix domain-containing protein [Jatrophihabitans sp.]|nr:helix-turn-helix domain-containing protein [Jatrophihabitans sp.]
MTSPTDADAGRPLRRDAIRNRALLVAAGREVFAQRGLEASLDEVARQAGVGVGTAYRHFGTKFELAEAIMHEAIEEVVAAAERAAEAVDPWLGLLAFLEKVLEVQTKDRGLREVLLGMTGLSKPDDLFDRMNRPVRAMVARAQHAGEIRADVEPSDLGCIIAMLCEVSDLGADVQPLLWRRYLDVLLAGLRPGAPALPGRALTDEEFRAVAEQQHAIRHGAPAAAKAGCVTRPIQSG